MNCMYCTRDGKERMDLTKEESAVVCDSCWKLLRDPKTALPFLRGHLTLQLRGTMPAVELERRINIFMAHLTKMKRPG
jgi:hypothetical protein